MSWEDESLEAMPHCGCPRDTEAINVNWRFCTDHQVFWCIVCDGFSCPACEADDIEYDGQAW